MLTLFSSKNICPSDLRQQELVNLIRCSFVQSSLIGFLLIKLAEQTDWSLTFPSTDPLVILLRLTIACSHFAGFHLAASPPPPVALAYPTKGQLELCALPTSSSVSVTKPGCADQG